MPKFIYIARDATGSKVSGSEDAFSQDELIGRLQAKNLVVVNVISEAVPSVKGGKAPSKPETKKQKSKYKRHGISNDDIVVFSRQLSTLLGAGVTILKSLDIISKQTASRKFYDVIIDLERTMENGLSFNEAIAKHPKVFSELWINLVESGEASGNLAVVLNRLASYLERRAEFKRKIVSSLMYPMILMLASIGALLFLTIKIVPTFAELFRGFGAKLPLVTVMLIMVSEFLRKFFVLIIIITGVSFFLLKQYINTKDGRRNFERMQYSLPVFGEFFRSLIVERFSSEMSTLIESGVPLLYSLEITEHSVSNLIMADIVHKVKDEVREGKPLSSSLDKSEFFEPLVVQMIAVGEEIGELPQMFKRINAFYQEYTETFLTRLTALFEPMMLIFMGGVIGLMVVGMFLPIFQLAQIGSK